MTRKYSEKDPLDEAKKAYQLFVGDDPSGKISLRALKKIAKELNEQLTEEELKGMIDEFDNDNDGYSLLKSQRKRVFGHYDYLFKKLIRMHKFDEIILEILRKNC